jgi:thymidylate synthase ThyX
MRSHPLPESRAYADLMLTELRKVIPSFLKRVDLDDRGVAWSTYLSTTRSAMEEVAAGLFPANQTDSEADDAGVTLLDWDPDGEIKLVTAMLYAHTHVSEASLERRVRAMTTEERVAVIKAYVGDRANRRHKPGRAFERLTYRFDVLADYGAFRDLQRHRMLSIVWQPLSPRHGFTRPEAVELAECGDRFDEAMERSADLHDALIERFPAQAAYAVSLAYKVRFYLHLNAREAMHLLELRTTPQGHPAYRVVGQAMHRLIAEQAGHTAVAEAMRFVDHSPEPSLERLDAERRAEARRQSR